MLAAVCVARVRALSAAFELISSRLLGGSDQFVCQLV